MRHCAMPASTLETGGKSTGPEVRAQALFRDRFVGVVRSHPLSKARSPPNVTPRPGNYPCRPAGQRQRARSTAPWRPRGIQRRVATIAGGYSAALALTRACDLVATVPERHTGDLRAGLFSFALPLTLPPITVSMLWHPRMDGDPAHRVVARVRARGPCRSGGRMKPRCLANRRSRFFGGHLSLGLPSVLHPLM